MNQLPRIPVIGIVGGIGSGKSAVARTAAMQIPLTVIDCDRLGHEVLDLPNIKLQLRNTFGNQIFRDDGRIERSTLGQLVFGTDSTAKKRRQQLEEIVHPEIQQQVMSEIQQARRQNQTEAILLDAAVLLESNWQPATDAVAFIDASADVRLARVRNTRNWTQNEWARREASQWPLEKKKEAADVVIPNNNDVQHAAQQLVEWIQKNRADVSVNPARNGGWSSTAVLGDGHVDSKNH